MTRFLSLDQVHALHAAGIAAHGGDEGIHDQGLIDSAVAQPRMTLGGQELYPTLIEKAAAIGHASAANHGFVDGNKRVGFAAPHVMLLTNGWDLSATNDEVIEVMLEVADKKMNRTSLTDWVRSHAVPHVI